MGNVQPTISACLVVYHEAAVIERCLQSLQGLVDEIIVVHDGECRDETLVIAKRYTDKIFVREHAGMMEAHLVFAFEQATGDWLLRIDADEFFSAESIPAIRDLSANEAIAGVIFPWEMWNGRRVITFPGLQKMCMMRRQKFHYCGIPHESGTVDGAIVPSTIRLHHRPAYNNIAWRSFLRKSRAWVPVHARYYFPETMVIDCFACDTRAWQDYTRRVRKHIILYLIFHPIKMAVGQLKNGLWKSRYGMQVVCERYVYYVMLYWAIYRRMRLPQEYV